MFKESPNKVLVIVAHQDDETIGSGGTLNKWSESGCEIDVIFVTDGETGIDQRDLYDESSIKSTRMEEAKEAAKILGINNIKTLGVSCQQVDFSSQKLFHSIISEIRSFKPELVLTHSPNDKHRDHKAVSKLAVEACWKSNEDIHSELGVTHRVVDIWGVEITDLHDNFDFGVKLSDDNYNAKINAFSKYTSQDKVIKGMINNIEGMAKVRGYACNTLYAEGFKRISSIPIIL